MACRLPGGEGLAQRAPVGGGERAQQLLLERANAPPRGVEVLAPGRRDAHLVGAAVDRLAGAGDQLAPLQAVEQRDQAGLVVSHAAGQRSLGVSRRPWRTGSSAAKARVHAAGESKRVGEALQVRDRSPYLGGGQGGSDLLL